MTLDRGPEDLGAKVHAQIWAILATAPDDWYGGREITQTADFLTGCTHRHTTQYGERTFCRVCGRWFDAK